MAARPWASRWTASRLTCPAGRRRRHDRQRRHDCRHAHDRETRRDRRSPAMTTWPAPGPGPRLSAGVLTADLTRLGAELGILRGTDCWAHVDVMDGTFCPQLTVGPAFVAAVASAGIPVDAHLLVEEPRRLLPEIAAAGAAVITVHAEATRHLHRTLTEMTELSRQGRPFIRGVAINPGTPVHAVEPVLALADLVLVLAVSPGWSGQAARGHAPA